MFRERSHEQNQLRLHRIRLVILALAMVFYPLWGFLFSYVDPDGPDSFLARLPLAGVLFILLLVMTLTRRKAAVDSWVMTATAFVVTADYFRFAAFSDVPPVYATGTYVTVMACLLILDRASGIVAYNLFCFVAVAIIFHLHHDVTSAFILGGVATILPAASLIQVSRLRSTARLEESQEVTRKLAQSLPVPVVVTRLSDGKFLFANEAFTETMESGGENIWETSASSYYSSPEERENTMRELERAGDIKNKLMSRVSPNGKETWVSVNMQKVTLGHEIVVISSFFDLTERIEAEQEREKQRAHLVETSRLSSLGMMAAGIAHEINNPLAIIYAKSHRLQKKTQDDEVPREDLTKDLDQIERNAMRIHKIIQGLRYLARDGRGDPCEETTVGAIFDIATEVCQSRFRNHAVKLTVDEEGRDYKVSCRITQIGQVLTNLLANAFDAAQESEDPWVRVFAVEENGMISLAVEDSGPGLSQEAADQLFQPFFTTKGVGKGTGLGLSISKSIIEEHEGRLFWDENAPSTRIVVQLKAAEEGTDEAAHTSVPQKLVS